MSNLLAQENIWLEKPIYDEAERVYYETISKEPLTPLAEEVAKARQRLIEIKHTFNNVTPSDNGVVQHLENKVVQLEGFVTALQSFVKTLECRINIIEKQYTNESNSISVNLTSKKEVKPDDDDVDLFGSDSDGDEVAEKIREERLAAYAAKKSKKPALIAKSNIILDIKPWDDETDMKAMEAAVRKIVTDGLLWGAAKLVPLAYGIHKLQISSVVEDDKVSVDWMQEQIEAIEDFVQSVDIAAFNKV